MAALLAVGLAAGLAVLLVVLPTLESACRPTAPSARRRSSGRSSGVGQDGLPFRRRPPGRPGPRRDQLAETLAGEVAIQYSSAVDVFQEARVSVTAPQQPAYLGRLVRGIPMEPTVLGDGDAVAAAAPLRVGGGQSDGWIVAARPLSGAS